MKKKTEEKTKTEKGPEYIFMDDIQWPRDNKDYNYLKHSESD